MNARYFGSTVAACAIAVVLCLAAAAPAAALPPGANIGAHFGYVKAADADDGNGQVGAHLEIPLLPFLGIQGSVDYRLVETFPITGSSSEGDLEIKSVPVTATARLYLPAISSMTLFAGAGAGWYYLIYDYSTDLEESGYKDDNVNDFGWHVAAGALFRVAPRLSFYGEGRLIFIDSSHEIDQELIDDVEDLDYDSFYIAAGVNLHF